MSRQTLLAMLGLMLLCTYHMVMASMGTLQMTAHIVNFVSLSANETPNLLAFASNNLNTLPQQRRINTARINAQGVPNSAAHLAFVKPTITLHCKSNACKGEKITLNHFSFNGPISKNGNGIFDRKGKLDGVTVAATEMLQNVKRPGIFTNNLYIQLTSA